MDGVYEVADGRETACVRWIQEDRPDGEWLLSYSFGYDSPEASQEADYRCSGEKAKRR